VVDYWGESPVGETVTFAWASWGSSAGCSLDIDGVEQSPSALPVSRATYALTTDFTANVAASTSAGGAGIGLSEQKDVDGFYFALFDPGAGRSTTIAPDGTQRGSDPAIEDAPFTGSYVAEDSTGTWTFDVQAAANPQSRILLWSIDIPRSATEPGG
jgi:hypothetical protein